MWLPLMRELAPKVTEGENDYLREDEMRKFSPPVSPSFLVTDSAYRQALVRGGRGGAMHLS